ncbi:MAG TPA: potassium-transporting ATPase subunit KdpA [Chloroflexota bacterium]|nr:potassium-transporting ATPase subunit KdpA [Chloroflexota bacterium]
MAIDILQMVIMLVLAFLIMIPLGRYMAAVFMNKHTFLDRALNPVDNAIYRVCGVKRDEGMRWPGYIKALLLTNLAMWILIFAVMELQHEPWFAGLNPDGQGPINPFLAFMQASSFITNTDWQNYGGESTFSYMSQMFGLIFPMFTSAATGLACGVAFIRGIGGSVNLGNFYVDLTRGITRIMLPISLVLGIAFVGFGIPATFDGAQAATTLNGPLTPASPAPAASPAASATPAPNATPTPATTPSATSQGQQIITRGPVAALASIKHLGTNGGGWFNANSAHPFENPSPITNVLEFLLMAAIPMSIIYMLGIMLDKKKQAWVFFWVLAAFFVAFLAVDYVNENAGNPLLTNLGVSAAQGNMEGKEVRFGQAQTAVFTEATTAFTTGTVDAMHDSMTPGGSVTPFSNMFLNMVFGGKGVGFINLFIFAVLGVFMTGLMVGRTPELLGKKIEVHEVKLASLAFLMHPLLILGFMALTFALQLDLSAISNPGPHGFSEVMYAYTSMAANNGSAFAGLSSNTNWYNVSGGITVILGRYVSIVLMLALAGSMAAKKTVPMTVGTMRTDNKVFAGVLIGTVLIIGALTFFPVMALGPIADHLAMIAGQTFSAAAS